MCKIGISNDYKNLLLFYVTLYTQFAQDYMETDRQREREKRT